MAVDTWMLCYLLALSSESSSQHLSLVQQVTCTSEPLLLLLNSMHEAVLVKEMPTDA